MRNSFKIRINSQGLIGFSVFLFTLLYFLPITITLPDMIRKPLLIIGLLVFVVALLMNKIKYLVIYVIACVIALLFFLFSWSSMISFGSYMFPTFVSLEFYICSLMILDKEIKITKKLIWIILIICLITSITSIIGSLRFPLAIRTLGQSATDDNLSLFTMYRRYNIAGWGLIYAICFLEGSMIHIAKMKKNGFILGIIVVDGICVLMSQLTFAILLSAMVIFLTMINGKGKMYIIKILSFSLIFIILWLERKMVLSYLYEFASQTNLTMLQLRVKNISDLILLNDSTGDAGARFSLYTQSFNSFKKYPLGLFFVNHTDIENLLGFHSDFFDMIGAIGIIGIVGIVLFVYNYCIRVRKITDDFQKRFLIIMGMSFGILFFVNPVLSQPHIWLATLLIPSSIIMHKWDGRTTKKSSIIDFE